MNILSELRGHCVRGLTDDHHQTIAARLRHDRSDAAARALDYSTSQFRRRWDQTKELALVPIGLPPHDDLLMGLWLSEHRECCTREAWSLLENDSRFAS